MEHLGRDEHGTWLACRPPIPFEGPESPGVFEHPFVTVIPEGRWWMASYYREDNPLGIDIYVDIATPAAWVSDSHVTMIDLDLDVVLPPSGEHFLDDEDEFEQHLIEYGYPDEIVATARRTAAEMMEAVAGRREPFGDVGRRWLEKL